MTVLDTKAIGEDGRAAVHCVRRAMADVIACVGGDPSQPQELSRRFGLDKTLTWRIGRVIRAEDAWDAIEHIPRRPSMRIFTGTMAKHGAPQDRLDLLTQALEQFEQFVETHCGDRETLVAMVSGMPKRSAEKRMEAFRKTGFHANSAVWGVRAQAHFSLNVMVPAARAGMLDIGIACGFSGLLRLRPNVPWAVASARTWEGSGGAAAEGVGRTLPLHPQGLFDGVPILPEFCSDPLPELRTVRAPGGNSRFELTGGPVGNTAAATVVLSWRWADSVPMYASGADTMGEHGLHLSTPAEVAIVDLLVHRSLEFALKPVARVYSELPSGPRYPTEGPDAGRLPVPENVIDLGSCPPDTTLPEVPRYGEYVEFVVGRMGHVINDFHGFRYRLRYPPIPSFAILQHPLLQRAAE